jgi:Asp-tRNA(Asn)/Glu-tRNA(Gln) amidotransferase A subunit family amidase
MLGSDLPVGLQITCRPFQERRALEIALAIENIVGRPPAPDLNSFLN